MISNDIICYLILRIVALLGSHMISNERAYPATAGEAPGL
jgi:hypothetical protein